MPEWVVSPISQVRELLTPMVAPALSICGLSLRSAHSLSAGSVNPLSPAKAQQPISSGTNTFLAHAFATRTMVSANPICLVEQVTCTATQASSGVISTSLSTYLSMNSAGS